MPRPRLVYQKGVRHCLVVQYMGGCDRRVFCMSQEWADGNYQRTWLVTAPEADFPTDGD